MKTQCEQKIVRLEAELETLKKDQAVKTDFSDFVDEALIRLQNLLELYQNGDIEQKRFIIGSIYPEKWRIFENDCRNTQINSAALLIYQINNGLGKKKAGVRTKIRTKSGSVPPDVLRSNQFIEDLVKIATIPLENAENMTSELVRQL